MTQTLAQVRATVTATAAAALPNSDDPTIDPDATQASLALRARLLASLFGAAAERAQGLLLPKLERALGAAVVDVEEAERACAAGIEEGEGQGEVLGAVKGTLEELVGKLRGMAIGEGNDGMMAVAAVESC